MASFSSPDNARAKLDWAEEHFKRLQNEIETWEVQKPYTIAKESNAEQTRHVFRIHFDPWPDLARWGLMLGDCLHNLRGALDYGVYQLAMRDSGKNPPDRWRQLQFPITDNEDRWLESLRRDSLYRIDGATIDAIHQMQPHPGRQDTTWGFTILREFNDADKHRLPILSLARPASYTMKNLKTEIDGTTPFWKPRLGPLEQDAEVVEIVARTPQPDVDMDRDLAIYVSLEDVPMWGGQPRTYSRLVSPMANLGAR